MELVQQQAERLQQVTAELDEARASLQHRKLIERAKGLLMTQAGHTEEEAYQALRRHAMQQGRRVVDVAEDLLQRTN
jgi:AmiR/NasT family two-component response regulator